MSILSRFARAKESTVASGDLQPACSHRELAPRWDSVADMGNKDKISSLTCTGCKATFSPEEAERLAVV